MASIVYKTVCASGGSDYLTLQEWWADRKGDLVSRDTIEVARLRGSVQHTSGVQLLPGDATVDSGHYVQIEGEPGWDHPGVFDRTKSYLSITTGLDIQLGWTRIGPGLCIYPSLDFGNPVGIRVRNIADDAPVIIDRVIIHKYGDYAFRFDDCSGITGHCVKNCIFLNATSTTGAIYATGSGTKVTVYNSTFMYDSSALNTDNNGVIISQNNYFGGTAGYAAPYAGDNITKGDHDMTWDDSALTETNQNIDPEDCFYFVNWGCPGWHEGQTGISDWHLLPDSPLIGAGTDLSSVQPESFRPTVGIDSQTRTSWDVGADEYTVPTVVDGHVGSGQEYATMAAWVSARKGNLATRDTVERAVIHSFLTERVFINSDDWGINYKNYPVIMPASGMECSGIFRTDRAGFKMPDGLTGSEFVLNITAGTKIERGLVIDADPLTPFSASFRGIKVVGESASPIIIDGLVFRVTDAGGSWAPSFLIDAGLMNRNKQNVVVDTVRSWAIIKNCVIIASQGIYTNLLSLGGACFKLYNNIGIIGLIGYNTIIDQGGVIEDNNYWIGKLVYNSAGISKGTHSATQNAEAVTASLRNIPFTTANFVNVTQDSEDLHLVQGSVLRGRGLDLRSAGVTYDMDGELRGATFDIGADQTFYPITGGALFLVEL